MAEANSTHFFNSGMSFLGDETLTARALPREMVDGWMKQLQRLNWAGGRDVLHLFAGNGCS